MRLYAATFTPLQKNGKETKAADTGKAANRRGGKSRKKAGKSVRAVCIDVVNLAHVG